MSVAVSNVTKLYGKQKALDEVSFEINRGQVVGFLGPNGAGKSTMMKIITCFIPPTSGSVKVNGFDIDEQSIEVRKQVGYLPENNPLYPDMYVKEYLQFVGSLHLKNGVLKNRVDEMIQVTGLQVERHKKIGALSRGYRQRVGLAQALIHQPSVLILDEPTSGLDPNQLVEIRNLIKETGKEKTVILSTHIMQEVEAICDRVIIINKGKIVADEKTEELQKRMAGENVIVIELSGEVSKQDLQSIPGIKRVEDAGKNKWKLVSPPEIDARTEIFRFAVERNLTVLTLNKEESSLEEIFQKLTTSPAG